MEKQVNRINNRIITLKTHNSNNTTRNSLLKTTFIKRSQHKHYQFVVAPIDKAIEMLHLFVKASTSKCS